MKLEPSIEGERRHAMTMYTGCWIEKLYALKLTDVGEDYFQIRVGKTEANTRRFPIHSKIKQMVERLVQNSKDGYMLNGLSADNALI